MVNSQVLEIASKFLEIIALAVLPVLATYVAKWIKAKIAILDAELSDAYPSLEYALRWAAELAVDAAEASGMKDLLLDKKALALSIAEQALADRGLTVDLKTLDAAIEQAWVRAYGQEKIEAAKAQ